MVHFIGLYCVFSSCANVLHRAFVNRTNWVHKFSLYVYCFSLHVSGNYVPIIKRKFRTYATPGICHSRYTDECLVCKAD